MSPNYLNTEMATQDRVATNYEYLRYKLPYARTFHAWAFRRLVGLADADKLQGIVLDNGCGTGNLTQYLPHGATLEVGLDLSREMLRFTQQVNPNVLQSDARDLPLAGESVDLIFAHSLFHHLPDPLSGLREVRRVLKPGGQVIAIDTNRSLLSALPRAIAYKRDNFSEYHQNFDGRQYLRLFQETLTVERVEYWGYLAYPFGFPDMMGPFRRLPFPTSLVQGLIQIDERLSRIPLLRTQSWWIVVVGRKPR